MRNSSVYKMTAGKRAFALFLAFCLSLSLLPGGFMVRAAGEEEEEGPLDEAVSTLVEWNVMRGDENGEMHPEQGLTRAEFAAMLNRAYGYTLVGETPFRDVDEKAWYADDIAIAYRAGYLQGTSPVTAEPEAFLTREETMVMLARNMRLKEEPGEVLDFNDGHEFQDWSKGYVKAAMNAGMLSGYSDDTFRPGDVISRGEMARFLCTAVGNLVRTPGTQSLGNVYGNVTVSARGAELKDTVIGGDLFISGGVGLGGVKLENVEVLGKIVVAGAGAAEGGEDSVTLRNVSAEALTVDSMNGQPTSISAQGDTLIDRLDVRTGAYIEDRTLNGLGFGEINLDAAPGTSFTLAGNLGEVKNLTPGSTVLVSQATVGELTVHEEALGARTDVDPDSVVNKLNLDTSATVTGTGGVKELTVGADGSNVSMMADKINIRPGVTSTVNGTQMNASTAKESSLEPQFMAGYPKLSDIAPTSVSAAFSTNKAGTVYWAVSAVSDGSIGEEELIKPSSYGSKAVRSGNVRIRASKTEVSVRVTGLTSGGTYYLSAMLVDANGRRSPVSVAAFSTPDDTTPAFASGYPYISKVTNNAAQVAVMTNKTCVLYYALMPKGSTAPKVNDFKTSNLPGNLGQGIVTMTKNVPDLFYVNSQDLQEKESYDLYLWLTDLDGAKSSAVRKVTVTTVDKTPPVFENEMSMTRQEATRLGLTCVLNEAGTVYWVAVKSGTTYPKPRAGTSVDYDNAEEYAQFLASDFAKVQVENGVNGLKSGRAAARAGTNVNFTVSGLEAETSYDIYYIAKDTAGNYSSTVKKFTANTKDGIPPKLLRQEFSAFSGSNRDEPYADTDIDLVFSEGIMQADGEKSFLNLYNEVKSAAGDAEKLKEAKENLGNALRNTVALYSQTGDPVNDRVQYPDAWVIDYREAIVSQDPDTRELHITFQTGNKAGKNSALNLSTGATYYFHLSGITDTSNGRNPMGDQDTPQFKTIASQVFVEDLSMFRKNITLNTVDAAGNNLTEQVHAGFSLDPRSTSKAGERMEWDMLIWADAYIRFNVYRREYVDVREAATATWQRINASEVTISKTGQSFEGVSLTGNVLNKGANFDLLNTLDEDTTYEYAIQVVELDGKRDESAWSTQVNFRVNIVAGGRTSMSALAVDVSESNFKKLVPSEVSDITAPKTLETKAPFMDREAPYFQENTPRFETTDSAAFASVVLNRGGTVYYLAVPVDGVTRRTDAAGNPLTDVTGSPLYDGINATCSLTPTLKAVASPTATVFDLVPSAGETSDKLPSVGRWAAGAVSNLDFDDVINKTYTNNRIKKGSAVLTSGSGAAPIDIRNLESDQWYYVYFTIKGAGQVHSENVQVFKFKTKEVSRPVLTLTSTGSVNVMIQTDIPADVNYVVVKYNRDDLNPLLLNAMWDWTESSLRSSLSDWMQRNGKKKETFTVMDALRENAYATAGGSTGDTAIGSIFDVYANQTIKNSLQTYISAEDPAQSGDTSIVDSDRVENVRPATVGDLGYSPTIYCDKLDLSPSPAQYAMLACAKNPDGSGYAFRAIYPLMLADKTPPMVNSVNTEGLAVYDDGNGNRWLQGTLVVNFTDELCYLDTDATPYKTIHLDHGPINPTSTKRANNYMSIMSQATFTAAPSKTLITIAVDENKVNQPLNSLSIDISPATSASVSFPANKFCKEHGSGVNKAGLNISIKIVRGEPTGVDTNGNPIYEYVPQVKISSGWDATE